MRIPKSWDDKDLLQDEPFCTQFRSRRATRQSLKTELTSENDEHWISPIVQTMMKNTGYEKVLQAWLSHALPEKIKKKKSKSIRIRAYFNTEDEALRLFVRVYWHLSQESEKARNLFNKVRRKMGQNVKVRSTVQGGKNVTVNKRKAKEPLPIAGKRAKYKKSRKDMGSNSEEICTFEAPESQIMPVVVEVEHEKDETLSGEPRVDSTDTTQTFTGDTDLRDAMVIPCLEFEISEDDKGYLSDTSFITRYTPDESIPMNESSSSIRMPLPQNRTDLTPTTPEVCNKRRCVVEPNHDARHDHDTLEPSSHTTYTSSLTETSSQKRVGFEDTSGPVITLGVHSSENSNSLNEASSQPCVAAGKRGNQFKKRKVKKSISDLAATRRVSQDADDTDASTNSGESSISLDQNVNMQQESLKRTSGHIYSKDDKKTSIIHTSGDDHNVQTEMFPGCYNHGPENFQEHLEQLGSSQIMNSEFNGSINDAVLLPTLDAAFSEEAISSNKATCEEFTSSASDSRFSLSNGIDRHRRERDMCSSPYSKRGRKYNHIIRKRVSSDLVDVGNSKGGTEGISKQPVNSNLETSEAVTCIGPNSTSNCDKNELQIVLVDPANLKEEPECDDSLSESFDDETVLEDLATDVNSFCADTIKKNSEDKPQLPAGIHPPIWAASRQELCESFPWFRSYQSGVYHPKGVVKGYLLSAFSSKRDLFFHGGKLIISHGGGGSQILRVNGQLFSIISDDQDFTDSSVRALLHAHKQQSPIVLIMDDKYRLFPYDLRECTYAVLGYYWITNAWAEPEESNNERGYCIKYKFSFQWCESQGEPWWILSSKDTPCERKENLYTSIDQLEEQECRRCTNKSPTVYEHGWMCLNPQCSNFWRPQVVLSLQSERDIEFNYSAQFLELRKTPACLKYVKGINLRPPATIRNGIITSQEFAKGWWCQHCGRLSCRENWECWRCSGCGNVVKIVGRIRDPKEFWDQQHGLRFMHDRIHADSGISRAFHRWQSSDGCGSVLSFTFPHGRGTIYIVLGNPLVNSRANELFQLYQKQALESSFFCRYPLQSHALRGRMLANYFSQNSGAPYKYVAGTGNTTPFESAPSAVTAALQLIKDRSALVLGKEEDFNEILSAAYMEKQKMAFHSDSEPGLGPVVCSLSLGSIALMHFRLQASFISPDEQRRRELTLVLRHGDVLVMKGIEIQTKYEHTVVPVDFRIAATARRIDQGNSAQKAELS